MIFKLPTSVTDVLGSIPTWNSAKLFTCFLIGFQALRHLPFFHIVFLSLSLRSTNSVLFFFYNIFKGVGSLLCISHTYLL